MTFHRSAFARLLPLVAVVATLVLAAVAASAQSGSAGTIRGTVTDPSGAVISAATVTLSNAVSGYDRTTTTDANGQFIFPNVPFNPYSLRVSATGFASLAQGTSVSSAVSTELKLTLPIAGTSQTVTVATTGPMVEDDPDFHIDVDRDLFNKVPLESQSSNLSSLVTLTTPGVAADSNGLFHGLGDHASNSFSIDGEPITDQQSKIFSNQLPTNAVQSLEVFDGAPPAQYGGKTSLVIVATTRSGQGVTKPTGDIYGSYGSFGSATGGFDLSYGKKAWGNFIEVDGLNTGRFLDPPEFVVIHDKGNEENAFDRVDYAFNSVNSMHLDFNYTRSWFQNPNALQNLDVQNVTANGTSAAPTLSDVGDTDQWSQINTFNISPTFTHIISSNSVINWTAFVRRDAYNYYPSPNPLADLGPSNLQTASISQYRTLTNAGSHIDYTWVHGRQNVLLGVQYEQTFLNEHDGLGIVDNLYNAPCVDSTYGDPQYGYSSQLPCGENGLAENQNYLPVLAPYDLTRGGSDYLFYGHTDVKEGAFYAEDQIKAGAWNFNLGLRGDKYNGLADADQLEPRLGIAYQLPPTKTVLAVSYARTLESPFNENLVLSSQGCSNPVLAPLLNCQSDVTTGAAVSKNLEPGLRNEFHASLQQAFGQHLVVGGEYIWKYTHNAFDFSVLGNTPITFPIDWHSSKIPGYALHAEVPNFHNFSAYFVTSSVAARFYGPQVAGAGATGGVAQGQTYYPFRIDHDERFNQTTHLQYTLPGSNFLSGIWGGFNWRYDSGLVAGSSPCYNTTDPNSACPNSSFLPSGNPNLATATQTNPAVVNGVPVVLLVDNNIPASPNGLNPTQASYLPLTADEEFQSGLSCNGVKATGTNLLGAPLNPSDPDSPYYCPASQLTSNLLRIPAVGTGDNDKNPPRVAPRNLFDVTVGKNNIFHADKYKTSIDFTAVNVTNKYALYNFLSTFSGTHYVTPRTLTARVTLNF